MNLSGPIYVTDVGGDGKLMLGGMFRMHDEVGYPIDACFLESRERGFRIDWLEALADCWLNDCLKYDSFLRHANALVPEANLSERFKEVGATLVAIYPKIKERKNPVDVVCRYIMAKKKMKKPIFKRGNLCTE